MANPVVHFEITSKDPEPLRKFYGELFDWQLHTMEEMNYSMVHTHEEGTVGIDGGLGGTAPDSPWHGVTFYVQVDDPQKYLDRAEQLGGKTLVPVTEVPNVVTFALFSDPHGNVLGIVKE